MNQQLINKKSVYNLKLYLFWRSQLFRLSIQILNPYIIKNKDESFDLNIDLFEEV
ncbi:MAG: hypothetical protein AAFQ91_23945 [Cyanobacteria bacterium J06621_15]